MQPTYEAELVTNFQDIDEMAAFDAMLPHLTPISEEELGFTFDELLEISINQPEDKLVLGGLRQVIVEAQNSGYLNKAMQMAVTLGAMACLHDHLRDTAHEAGESLGLFNDHDKNGSKDKKHDAAKCHNCKNNKPCSNAH